LVNWWWKLLLLLLNICGSLVNYWILTKWCFNLKFYASLSMYSCIWPVNIIWDVFLGVERSKLECLGKRVLKFKKFWLSWWVFAWASANRALKWVCLLILDTSRLRGRQASSKRTTQLILDRIRLSEPEASEPRMLLEVGRLSEQPCA